MENFLLGRKPSLKDLGLVGTKKCKRCGDRFYPASGKQILCPYCQDRPKKTKLLICRIKDCGEKLGHRGGLGFCEKHYSKLVRWPREKQRLAEKREGLIVCKTLLVCQGYFKPTSKFHSGREKYCPACRHQRKKI